MGCNPAGARSSSINRKLWKNWRKAAACVHAVQSVSLEILESRRLLDGAGRLDFSFAGDGIRDIDFFHSVDKSVTGNIAVQADGRVLVASRNKIQRINTNGEGDGTFNFSAPEGFFINVIQPLASGKIMLGGTRGDGLLVARLNADGSFDTAFSSDGIATTSFVLGGGQGAVNDLAVHADGKVIAVGSSIISNSGGLKELVVARFNTNGSLDSTFSGDGRAADTFLGGDDQASSVAIQGDGKIVVAGAAHTTGNASADALLVRYNSNGALDASYSGNGWLNIDRDNFESIVDLALQPDGKAVGVGFFGDGGAVRVNTNGTIDTSFSGDGFVIRPFNEEAGGMFVLGVELQKDGKILLGGGSELIPEESFGANFRVARLLANGTLDSTFGDGGVARMNTHHREIIQDIALAPDQKIIFLGDEENVQLVLGRLHNDDTGYVPDTQPPTTPGNLHVTDVLETEATLRWDASTDDNSVQHYSIYRERLDGSGIKDLWDHVSAPAVSYVARNLMPGTQYRFFIEAVDVAGNKSTQASVSFTTDAEGDPGEDTQAPTNPQDVRVIDIDPDAIEFDWHAAADNVGVAGYEVFRDGVLVATLPGDALGYRDTGLTTSTRYSYVIRAFDAAGNRSSGDRTDVTTTSGGLAQPPFNGSPFIPGQLIQAEDFDLGGEGVAYHDLDAANNSGAYRANEAVDIKATTDTGGGHFVGWTNVGEWMEYTIDIPEGGTFTIDTRVASSKSGGRFSYTLSGFDVGGAQNVPDTGSFFNFTTVTSPQFTATAGQYVLRLKIDSGAVTGGVANFNWLRLNRVQSSPDTQPPTNPQDVRAIDIDPDAIEFDWHSATDNVAVAGYEIFRDGVLVATLPGSALGYDDTGLNSSTRYEYLIRAFDAAGNRSTGYRADVTTAPGTIAQTPFHGTPFAPGQLVQAEDFDRGGEGVAYHDLDASNNGGAYRTSESVDIKVTTDAGGGQFVGWTNPGEWIEYTVNLPESGTYVIETRLASSRSDGRFSYTLSGSTVGGAQNVPNTGSFFNFTTVTSAQFSAAAGQHVLRLKIDSGPVTGGVANFNWIRVVPASTPNPSDASADLHVRVRKAPAYTGDNIVNGTAAGQTAGASSNFEPILYELRIQNDGSAPDRFRIIGPERDSQGFRIAYFDSPATGYKGGKNITAAVSGAGWWTPTLDPGQTYEFRADVTPTALVRGNTTNQTPVRAISERNSNAFDVVRVDTSAPVSRVVEIRRLNYDDSGIYRARVENHGNVPDRLRIIGPAGGTGWSIRYYDDHNGGNDVTTAVTSGGYLTRELAPKEYQELRMVINKGGAVRTVRLRAESAADPGRNDFDDFVTVNPNVKKPPVFPIAVWSQPTYNFSKWKTRGVNTLMRYEGLSGSVSNAEWSRQAANAGYYMIRQPGNDLAADAANPNLIAWMQRDEPDIYGTSTLPGLYQSVKAAGDKPVLTNFAGSIVMDWHATNHRNRQFYEDALQYTDWPSTSIYPVNGWNRPEDLDVVGRSVDRMQKYADGEFSFAFVDTVDSDMSWLPESVPGPTPDQFRAEVWDAIIQGAQGIAYFPFRFMPDFSFDATNSAIAAEMTTQNARITSIGQALLSPIDPSGIGIDHSPALRATWRIHNGKAYFIVLNFSDQALSNQQMKLHGVGSSASVSVKGENRSLAMSNGAITDSFQPFAVHIYEMPAA